jgi:hypothetical protein
LDKDIGRNANNQRQQHLTVMLRGFYQYFALHHCDPKLSASATKSTDTGRTPCNAAVNDSGSAGCI